jgi:predicted nucleic acid-binding Zn ribbon protein
MLCPFCAAELESEAVACEKCGAIRVARRTTAGVFVGFVGLVAGLILVALWIPLLFLPFIGYDMGEFPWLTLIVGTAITVGLLWYSKSTLHSEWIRKED